MSCHWPRLIGSGPGRREDTRRIKHGTDTARDGAGAAGGVKRAAHSDSTASQEWVAISASFRMASRHCGEGQSRPAPGTARAPGLADRPATRRQRWPINRDILPLVPLNKQLLRQRQSLPSISQLAIKTPYSSSTSRQIRAPWTFERQPISSSRMFFGQPSKEALDNPLVSGLE